MHIKQFSQDYTGGYKTIFFHKMHMSNFLFINSGYVPKIVLNIMKLFDITHKKTL